MRAIGQIVDHQQLTTVHRQFLFDLPINLVVITHQPLRVQDGQGACIVQSTKSVMLVGVQQWQQVSRQLMAEKVALGASRFQPIGDGQTAHQMTQADRGPGIEPEGNLKRHLGPAPDRVVRPDANLPAYRYRPLCALAEYGRSPLHRRG
ncbi:hypothetical protein D3C76_1236700 [compost metagenome]